MELPRYKNNWSIPRTKQFIKEICMHKRLQYDWNVLLDYFVRRDDCNAIYVGNEVVFSNYLPIAQTYSDHVRNMHRQFMGVSIKEQGIDELVQTLKSINSAFIIHVFVSSARISFLHLPARDDRTEHNVIRIKN